MKILFICTDNYDYLQDLSFAGLTESLPYGSVIDFAPHWQYRKKRVNIFRSPVTYPHNIGFSENAPNHKYTLSEILSNLQDNFFSIVVLASCKPDALLTFQKILPALQVPWFFIDGGDRTDIGGDFEREGGPQTLDLFNEICQKYPPALVFKREMKTDHNFSGNIFPLNFSFHSRMIKVREPRSEKKYQVMFRGVESSESRRKAFKLLAGRYDCDSNGTISGQKARKYQARGQAYFDLMSQTQISLSFSGVGFDTLRYWEIPASGSLMISERPTIQIPRNFEHKKHVLFCQNDLSDLVDIIDYYLDNKYEAFEIAEKGQQHLLSHHTHLHRADYILKTISKYV